MSSILNSTLLIHVQGPADWITVMYYVGMLWKSSQKWQLIQNMAANLFTNLLLSQQLQWSQQL